MFIADNKNWLCNTIFVSDPIYKTKALLIYLIEMQKCKCIQACVV